MAIAYAPLNIDVRLPDISKIKKYFDEHQHVLSGNADLIDNDAFIFVPVFIRASEQEWIDPKIAMHHYQNRWNTLEKPAKYLYDIDKIIPEIPDILNQLPYKELTMVYLLRQSGYVNPHYDSEPGDVYNDNSEISIKNEPHRINVLLSNHEDPNFFVSEFKDSEKIFPKITASRPCYAFAERYYWHGAEYTKPERYLLSVFGILDREKHRAMIDESVKLWPNDIVRFPDPDDEWAWDRHFGHAENKYKEP